jgi:D-serine deaminase-like pyridoxal phosphate-dependent protein
MRYMSPQNIQMLLSCLDLSYERAIAFDSRPGLKFLVQRVAGLERAANLYRQAGAAWTIKVVTLFDLCLHEVGRSGATLDKVKRILEDEPAANTEVRRFVLACYTSVMSVSWGIFNNILHFGSWH